MDFQQGQGRLFQKSISGGPVMRTSNRTAIDMRVLLLASLAFFGGAARAQNSPDSLGRGVKFQDATTFAQVHVYRPPASCQTNLSSVRCVALADPSPGSYEQINVDDMTYVDVAPFAAHSLLILTMNPHSSVLFRNFGTTSLTTAVNVAVRITIESEVLNNPTLRNPNTGLPYNGRIISVYSWFSETESLSANQYRSSSARRPFEADILSRRMLINSLGLNATQAADVFARPIRVKIGYVVSSLNLNSLALSASGRLSSD
jgi:hypothetical protein